MYIICFVQVVKCRGVQQLNLQPLHGCSFVWGILLSPRSRLRSACRQREVIEVATARAVERRVSYKCNELETIDINRASGYIVNNPTLAPQATMWGPKSAQDNPNRGAVAHPAAMGNSRPVRTPLSWAVVYRGLRFAHPRLSASPRRLGVTCFA